MDLLVVLVVHQVHSQTLHLVVEEEVLKQVLQKELVNLVVAVEVAEATEVAEALDLVILVHLPMLTMHHILLHLMVGEMMVEQTHILAA